MILQYDAVLDALEAVAVLFEENGAVREAHYVRCRVMELTRQDMAVLAQIESVIEERAVKTGRTVGDVVSEMKEKYEESQLGDVIAGVLSGEVSRDEAEKGIEELFGGDVEVKLVTAEELETLVAAGELEPVTHTEPMSEEESAALGRLMDKLCARADKAAGHE